MDTKESCERHTSFESSCLQCQKAEYERYKKSLMRAAEA